MPLTEYVPDQIWIQDYPIHYAGCEFDARMCVIRVTGSKLMLHSPCEIDAATKAAISALGEVAYIVAPGTFHHLDNATTARRGCQASMRQLERGPTAGIGK